MTACVVSNVHVLNPDPRLQWSHVIHLRCIMHLILIWVLVVVCSKDFIFPNIFFSLHICAVQLRKLWPGERIAASESSTRGCKQYEITVTRPLLCSERWAVCSVTTPVLCLWRLLVTLELAAPHALSSPLIPITGSCKAHEIIQGCLLSFTSCFLQGSFPYSAAWHGAEFVSVLLGPRELRSPVSLGWLPLRGTGHISPFFYSITGSLMLTCAKTLHKFLPGKLKTWLGKL